MVSKAPTPARSSADAFLRIWDRGRLTPTLARHILKLKLDESDVQRMNELAERNREGAITPSELNELDDFLNACLTLSSLQSRARRFLKIPRSGASRA